MNRRPIFVFAVLAALMVSSASAYVLLSPRRTWDGTPNFIIDNRGWSSITDGDLGRSAARNAIVSNSAWNGAGTGTRVSASIGSVAGWRLGDGIPMINSRDPQGVCTGSCLAATFTGYYAQRPNGTYRIYDADIVTNTAVAWTSAGEPDGCSNEYYIEAVLVREVGRALGLGSSGVAGATMNPSTITPCSNAAATLEADDRAAINALY